MVEPQSMPAQSSCRSLPSSRRSPPYCPSRSLRRSALDDHLESELMSPPSTIPRKRHVSPLSMRGSSSTVRTSPLSSRRYLFATPILSSRIAPSFTPINLSKSVRKLNVKPTSVKFTTQPSSHVKGSGETDSKKYVFRPYYRRELTCEVENNSP